MYNYSSNLSTAEYSVIHKFLPTVNTGRPRKHSEIDMLNSILYILHTGCQWRELPIDCPPWNSVYKYFRKLVNLKSIDHILYELNTTFHRGSHFIYKSILVVDTQSVQDDCSHPATKKGYDGHKKTYGIKRCVFTDVHGSITFTKVFPANTSEHICLRESIVSYTSSKAQENQFTWIIGDKGFESKESEYICTKHGIRLVPMRSTKNVRTVTKWDQNDIQEKKEYNRRLSCIRYVVEQTFAYLMRHRRLVRNYERRDAMHAGFVKLAGIRKLVRKLCS